jgi:hypothetical protein
MRIGIMRRSLLLSVLWLTVVGNVFSQQRAESYTFVSPNTRDNLTLDEAIRLLNSREELRLINDINRLSRCLRLKPSEITKTIGNSPEGAEHSVLFRAFTDSQTLRYIDARLGKLNRQKTVLFFRWWDDEGPSKMYVLRLRPGKRTLASIAQTLARNGVAFSTMVPGTRQRMFIYVVDLDDELNNQIVSAARQLGALVSILKGTAEFLGDDTDREKAQQVFADEIKRFEDANPKVARRCSR